jgi:uncharacterized protein YkwD
MVSQLVRSRKIFLVALLVALHLTFAGSALAAGAKAPKLKGKALANGVIALSWTLAAKDVQPDSLLELETLDMASAEFSPIAQYQGPSKKQVIVVDPGGIGSFFYRARVTSLRGISPWSRLLKVKVKFAPRNPNPAPIPAPTPVPTAAPTPVPNPDSGSVSTPPETPLAAGQTLCPSGVVPKVLELVNLARASYGLAELELHPQLQWSSMTHNIYMAASGVLSHDGWASYITQSGFASSYVAENIAMGYPCSTSVMDAWMNSAGHRANILGSYRYIGISCIIDQNGSRWWVQNFGQ